MNKLIRNEIASGSQRVDNVSHVSPTRIYNLFLILPYLEMIENPIIKEIITIIRLRLPCKISTISILTTNFSIFFY